MRFVGGVLRVAPSQLTSLCWPTSSFSSALISSLALLFGMPCHLRPRSGLSRKRCPTLCGSSQGFSPSYPALFNKLVTTLSKSLAHQAQVSASHTSFLCHRRREFYLSHLPAYFSDVNKRSLLSAPAVFADSLFREEDVTRLLESTRSTSSLKSQQAMVDVASRRFPSSSSGQRCSSPGRSPARSPAKRRRQSYGSPSRQHK